MNRHRTTARGVSLLLLTGLIGAAVVGSPGAAPKPGLIDGKPIVFPLTGDYAYTNNYGDPRVNGSHAGIDIENTPWRNPVVAAEAGKVRWHTTSSRAGCMLYLYGKSGTTYLYIHLNNDLTERSEDSGGCKLDVAYAVPDGAKVTAGEQIAWNGDSGDAEGNHHLHFEVHPDDGGDVNPFPYLNAAERLLFPGRIGESFSLGVRGVPIAAGAGTITIRASAVRWWPGGRWTSLVRERVVELAVAQGADGRQDARRRAREPGAPRRCSRGARRRRSSPPTPAAAKITAAALRGQALVAARITRPGGVTVKTKPPGGDGRRDDRDRHAGRRGRRRPAVRLPRPGLLHLGRSERAAQEIDDRARRRARGEDLGDAEPLELVGVLRRNRAADDDEDVTRVVLAETLYDPRHQRHVRARENRDPDRVRVLLDRGLDDLLRRLVEARVDDLHAGVAQ